MRKVKRRGFCFMFLFEAEMHWPARRLTGWGNCRSERLLGKGIRQTRSWKRGRGCSLSSFLADRIAACCSQGIPDDSSFLRSETKRAPSLMHGKLWAHRATQTTPNQYSGWVCTPPLHTGKEREWTRKVTNATLATSKHTQRTTKKKRPSPQSLKERKRVCNISAIEMNAGWSLRAPQQIVYWWQNRQAGWEEDAVLQPHFTHRPSGVPKKMQMCYENKREKSKCEP